MRATSSRYRLSFILSHWVLAPLILILLELGWYIQSLSISVPERNIFTDLHISLGLTSVVIVVILVLLRFFLGGPPLPHTISPWQRKLIRSIYIWIYVGLVVIALSGLLQAAASAIPIKFWGLPLLAWGTEAPGLVNLFWILHGAVAFVLTALVVIHLVVVLLPRYPSAQAPSATFPDKPQHSSASRASSEAMPSALSSKVALKLVKNFRRLGWTALGIQVGFAFISGLLLLFAVLGRSSGLHWAELGGGIFWAVFSLALVGITILFSCDYPRIAPKIALEPESWLSPNRKFIFWLLGLEVTVSLIGALTALAGVAASLALLVTKTASSDLLVLLVNFNLLVAHIVGMVLFSRALLLATKARRLISFAVFVR